MDAKKQSEEYDFVYTELSFQKKENEKLVDELLFLRQELSFQNNEKEKRAAELIIANKELNFQNAEKGKRAEELIVANKELVFQNEEKEKRASELEIANKELIFQNEEKKKRASELEIVNKELVFQNEEKKKRASELEIANKELVFQNEEKKKRASELEIANKELVFQNEEKKKRAAELEVANKELMTFTYISSHDLQEPLRKIQTFVSVIIGNENLSEKGLYNFQRIQFSAKRMRQLIDDLLSFSRFTAKEQMFVKKDIRLILEEVKEDLKEVIQRKNAVFKYSGLNTITIIPFQFYQLFYNLISNALKFSAPETAPYIVIRSSIEKGDKFNNKNLSSKKEYCHISISDNGIGFEPDFKERIFGMFQKLHSKELYGGTGIGLAIVKKIVENHGGVITATSELTKGATFDIYIPTN